MAAPRHDMMAMVASSVDDRRPAPTPSGESRPSLARMAEGRRRFDAACLIRHDRIIPDPNQPRTEFDPEALDELAASIRSRGQLQPIRVRWDGEADRYVIVVGERRWRAAAMAGLDVVACVVADGPSTVDDILEDQLVENCLRADLKPVEAARAFKALMDRRGLSQQALAERLHMSQASIARALALLALPAAIQADVDGGSIPASVASEIARIVDPEEQARVATDVKAGRLRREDVQERTKGTTRTGKTPKPSSKPKGRGGPVKFRVTGNLIVQVDRARGKAPLSNAEILSALHEIIASLEGQSRESVAA